MHPQVLVVLPCPDKSNLTQPLGRIQGPATDVLQHLGKPCWISDLLWSSAGNLSLASLDETTLGTLGVISKIWRIQVKCPRFFLATPKKIKENMIPPNIVIMLVGFYLWLSISPFQGWSISSMIIPSPKKLQKLRSASPLGSSRLRSPTFFYISISMEMRIKWGYLGDVH